jgi:hypothetical protein
VVVSAGAGAGRYMPGPAFAAPSGLAAAAAGGVAGDPEAQ